MRSQLGSWPQHSARPRQSRSVAARRGGGGPAAAARALRTSPRSAAAVGTTVQAANTAAAGATDLAARMLGFQAVIELPDGARLVIEALKPELMTPCAELLTTSFVATASNVAPYGRFVRRRIGAYLEEHAGLPPKALVLTAVVEQAGDATDSCSNGSSSRSDNSSSNGSSGSGSGCVLVGTAEVSFDPSTRSSYPTLNPPAAGAYVCNCAVDARWRRRGVATHLMHALETVAADAGEQFAYLHLRMRDNGEAGALYRSMGYEELKADGWWVALLGLERRWLMRKVSSMPTFTSACMRDNGEAGALYRSMGYEELKADSW